MPKYLDETGLTRFYDNISDRPVNAFDTVAEMQAATYLEDGMTCHTNGFHAAGDGGAAYYTVGASGTANGMDVLALQGGLFATLVDEAELNVKQFGAYGNGSSDDYPAIQAALTKLNGSGGTLLLPAGTYNVSCTPTIGSDTTVVGMGRDSYIYFNGSRNPMGAAIAVAGSNVLIDNISGGYTGDDASFPSSGSAVCFIGISTYTFDSCKAVNEGSATSTALVETSYKNVAVHNLYCESTYALQVEPSASGTIDGVSYEHIVCPYGVVSAYAGHEGAIKSMSINDVQCAFMRIGTGYDNNFVNISNAYCHMLRVTNPNTTITNVVVRYEVDSVVRDWVTAGTFAFTTICTFYGTNAENITVDACESSFTGLYVYSTVNSVVRYSHLTNVVVKNVVNASGDGVHIEGSDTYRYNICTNCDFSSNTVLYNTLNGIYIGCKLGTVNASSSTIYSDTHPRPLTITVYGNVRFPSSSDGAANCYYLYDTVRLECTLYDNTGGTFSSGTSLFTINARHAPKTTQRVRAIVWDTTDYRWAPCTVTVDTDGLVKMSTAMRTGVTYNRLTIFGEYPVGLLDG